MTTTMGMHKALSSRYDEALARAVEALKAEGFGVLTEIDVQSTLAQKLGASFRRYKILGACNPSFAHRALSADLRAGLMMPCNVIVYEGDDGRAVVLAVDPTQSVAAIGDPALSQLAVELKHKLGRVLDVLE